MDKVITVIGIGYIGLPLAIMLAKAGYKVVGVDLDNESVKAVNEGVLAALSISEKGLQDMMQEKSVKGNLTASEEVCPADVFVVSVQTPLHKRKKEADLSYVVSAINSILPHLREGNLILIESTMPPLTLREIIKPVLEENTSFVVGENIFLAHCPERVLPGNVFREIVHDNRIIGGIDQKSCLMAKEIYSSFVKGEIEIVDDVSAELVKLMENTYRDVNIALANELSLIAETLGVDNKKVIELANKHPRVNILNPGIGVGGHCLPVDPWFITEVDPRNSVLVQSARRINDEMPYKAAARIRKTVSGILDPKIVTLGITYKPDVCDLRMSPAAKVIELLREDGYQVEAYDPLVDGYKFTSIKDIAKGADCLAVLVEHSPIKEMFTNEDNEIKMVMRNSNIIRF
ncbi:nucleotide sugar dehydrogenase [Chloroflexota bacterium]